LDHHRIPAGTFDFDKLVEELKESELATANPTNGCLVGFAKPGSSACQMEHLDDTQLVLRLFDQAHKATSTEGNPMESVWLNKPPTIYQRDLENWIKDKNNGSSPRG